MLDRVSSPESQSSSAIEGRSFGPATLIESLEGIVYFLIRNRVAILASIGAAVLAALLYGAAATPIFTAHTQLLLDPRLPQVIRELSEARTLLDRSEIDNQIALMRSEQIARTALARSKRQAEAKPGSDPASALAAAEKTELVNVTDEGRMQQAIQQFQNALTVSRLGVSYVLEIAYSSPDPEMAARMANAAADAYIEDQLAARALAARQGSQWLEERIEELRQLMNSSALRLQQFKAKRDYRIVGKTDRSGGPASAKQPDADEDKAPSRITLEELESTAATYRKIYESYLQAHTESVLRQSFPIGSGRIITRATVPSSPSRPRRMRLLLLSIVVGAMGGIGIAFVREGLQHWRRLRHGSPETDERTSHEY
jgi:polysaccharide biosynthesis transport protein